ncbi:unannotated protein [freshwater metagenome]|uniref:glutamate formimidoyltransferase n=1 Tax=freshwater metagenome TaxID=449393 RepID=A0A6J7D0P0_9ZZZZ
MTTAFDPPTALLAVPNVTEGRDRQTLVAIAAAFAHAGARLLTHEPHADPDHDRAVFTIAAAPRVLSDALLAGAGVAVEKIDLAAHGGLHPHIGSVDVVPVVYLDAAREGAACSEALVVADRLADELDLPVLLYGALAGGRTRAELRRGGPAELARRLELGELRPDFGPARAHPTAGAVLVGARPPLVAFNLELAPPAGLAEARRIAALIRDGGEEGLPAVRAIGLQLAHRGGIAQVSVNVEDPLRVALAEIVAAVEGHARVASTELVGLAPRAAFDGWPDALECRHRATLEDALGL